MVRLLEFLTVNGSAAMRTGGQQVLASSKY
jgi:hypothetical protein